MPHNKAEAAREICEKLGLDYHRVYNENGGNVTTDFLEAVHKEVVGSADTEEILSEHQKAIKRLDQASRLVKNAEGPEDFTKLMQADELIKETGNQRSVTELLNTTMQEYHTPPEEAEAP